MLRLSIDSVDIIKKRWRVSRELSEYILKFFEESIEDLLEDFVNLYDALLWGSLRESVFTFSCS